jgi:hypothetical protein
MTSHLPPSQPDWTRCCKATDLEDLRGFPYMLRESDDDASPWKQVATTHGGTFWEKVPSHVPGQPEKSVRFDYVTVTFYDGTERMLNESDDIEVGLIAPPTEDPTPDSPGPPA